MASNRISRTGEFWGKYAQSSGDYDLEDVPSNESYKFFDNEQARKNRNVIILSFIDAVEFIVSKFVLKADAMPKPDISEILDNLKTLARSPSNTDETYVSSAAFLSSSVVSEDDMWLTMREDMEDVGIDYLNNANVELHSSVYALAKSALSTNLAEVTFGITKAENYLMEAARYLEAYIGGSSSEARAVMQDIREMIDNNMLKYREELG